MFKIYSINCLKISTQNSYHMLKFAPHVRNFQTEILSYLLQCKMKIRIENFGTLEKIIIPTPIPIFGINKFILR